MHLRIWLEQQHGDLPLYTGALRFDVSFYFPYRQSLSQSKRALSRGQSHIFKPDLSNLIKFIEDVGTGVLYQDDCLISEIIARKCYDEQARTELTICRADR